MENKRKYKIVASDLDGTLLNKEQTVSEENLRAIAQMNSLGVEFVPTTGRGMNEIDLSLINSPDIRYIITSNGAVVYDKNIGKTILTRYISKDTVRLTLETLRPYNVFIVVHEGGKTYYDKHKYNPEFLSLCGVDPLGIHFVTVITVPGLSDVSNTHNVLNVLRGLIIKNPLIHTLQIRRSFSYVGIQVQVLGITYYSKRIGVILALYKGFLIYHYFNCRYNHGNTVTLLGRNTADSD